MKRRSVYFKIKRSKLIPMMMLFDWPEHLVSIGQRANTTTAPQALLFMNSAEGRVFADGFAERINKHVKREKDKQPDYSPAVRHAYELALARSATDTEVNLATSFVADQRREYEASKKENAEKLAIARPLPSDSKYERIHLHSVISKCTTPEHGDNSCVRQVVASACLGCLAC